MAEKQAVYKIRVDGDDDLVRAGDRVDQRWSTVGKNLSQNVGGAVKAVGQGMLSLANDAIRVATAMNTINIGELVNQTRELGMSYTKFAVGSKQQLGEVKAEAERAGRAMLMDPAAVNQQARAFGALTYSAKTATKDLEALNEQATANNRDLGAELPLGTALRKMIGPSVDLKAELEKVRGQADALGYSGGPAAFADMLGSAADALGHVSMKSDEARTKVTSFLGALTKGLSPDAQKRVGSSMVSQLQSRHEQISRTIGEDILDPETGQVKDPARVMTKLRERALRLYGTGGALKVLRREFGAEEGTALYNFDQGAEDKARAALPSQGGEVAQNALVKSEAGQREQRKLDRERQQRDSIGAAGLAAQDAWGSLFDGHPMLGQAASWALGGLGSAATGYGGAKLAGKGAAAAKGIADVVAGAAGSGANAKAYAAAALEAFGGHAMALEPGSEAGLKVATAGLESAELFGKTAVSYGAKGLAARGLGAIAAANPLIDGAMFQAEAFNSLRTDSQFAQDRRSDVRGNAAKEIAGKIGRDATSGRYGDIYEAAPDIARLAKGVGVGKEAGSDDTMVRVLQELASKPDLPEQFQASVKRAFVEALRESGGVSPVVPNPSREKTQGAQAGAGGAS